jgi:hypothetical protein
MYAGKHHASVDVWKATICRLVKRFETFINVNRYVVKHASDLLHSSASMASLRAFGHMMVHLL